jgi:hypothetical protein
LLQRANNFLVNGNYAEAANAFEELAQGALTRGGPRASVFFMQAGRARISNGQTEIGINHLLQGLSILASRGQWQRVYRAGNRIMNELNGRNLTTEAKKIEDFLKSNIPAGFTPLQMQNETRKPLLPTHCPSCGAAVRPDEVEWLDDVTVECEYCGSPVRGDR